MQEHPDAKTPQLDLDDIQGTLLRRRPDDYVGAYVLYRVDDAAQARESLASVVPGVTPAADWESPRPFTMNIAFTYEGLQALGVPESSLESFSPEFRAGMSVRKDVLGDLGANDPEHWVHPFGSSDFHIGVIIIAGDENHLQQPLQAAAALAGVTETYRLRVASPESGREHFGFRDGISSPHIIGSTDTPLPGQDHLQPGEFLFGYPDESGKVSAGPDPEPLGRNGCYLAVRQLHADVAAFRNYLREHARSASDEDLLAAKFIGRWRSGAPLALCPAHDDPQLASDPQRNNAFTYDDDERGLAVPHGAHIRRVNPRDSLRDTVVDVRIHRVMRRGAAYGPRLPDDATKDDGAERGIIFVFLGASLSRQFEFVQQQWLNDGDFAGVGTQEDPLIAPHEEDDTFTIPGKPIRRHLTGLPRFVTVRGGEYCFLPSITALRWIAQLPESSSAEKPHTSHPKDD